jgi:hypothetical protein
MISTYAVLAPVSVNTFHQFISAPDDKLVEVPTSSTQSCNVCFVSVSFSNLGLKFSVLDTFCYVFVELIINFGLESHPLSWKKSCSLLRTFSIFNAPQKSGFTIVRITRLDWIMTHSWSRKFQLHGQYRRSWLGVEENLTVVLTVV